MRTWYAGAIALWCAMLAGCSTSRAEKVTALASSASRGHFEGPTGEDVVLLDVAVVEQPWGDRFLNRELWELADEQGVALERAPILAKNGFRVCRIAGLPPAGLQRLLASRRSCPDPRHIRRHAGDALAVALGPVCKSCTFRLEAPGVEEEVSLADAQCFLEVLPTLADEGRVLLRFTPQVRHGQQVRMVSAQKAPDGALDWNAQVKQPEKAYPAVGWELTVGPSEYVVVGTWLDPPDTLGQRCFRNDAPPQKQKLLVIRTSRARSGPPADESITKSPPLALQAGWTSARGTSR